MKIFRNYLKLLRHIQEEQGNSWYTSASLISSKYRRDGDVLLPCSQFLLFLGYKENNEELQAQLVSKSLEEGRTLLNHANNNSLAAEFEAMSENEVRRVTRQPPADWREF